MHLLNALAFGHGGSVLKILCDTIANFILD